MRHWAVAAGTIDGANELPEGARLQLDPQMGTFEHGSDSVGRVIARALQQYGMIVVDVPGSPTIMVKDLTTTSGAEASWAEPTTQLPEDTISAIPVEAFRVLALPDTYDSGAAGARHGDCSR